MEKLFNERLREFRRGNTADEALRREMAKISRTPFTDEIEQTEPPRKFSMPHFTSFKGDGDPERHLKHYRSAMVLYRSNDALMCKIFATTLQGEAQDWFHTLPPRSVHSFDDLSLVFTKEYSSYRSIKKKSDHLFNVKKNPKESLRDYVKRFKAEKAKIVGCDDSIASAAFQKGLPADHPLFGEMIMKEDLTLADSFALAEKHALWDEARRADKVPEQPTKRIGDGSKKGRWKAAQQERAGGQAEGQARDQRRLNGQELLEVFNPNPSNPSRRKRRAVVQAAEAADGRYFQAGPYQVLRVPSRSRSHHRKLLHLEELSREACEGRQSRQIFGQASSAAQTECWERGGATAKTIRINGIFAESEHLGATNNSKKRKIQQAWISQVQTAGATPGPIIGFTEQDAEGVDLPHDDALVVSVQIAHAIID